MNALPAGKMLIVGENARFRKDYVSAVFISWLVHHGRTMFQSFIGNCSIIVQFMYNIF